MPEELIIEFTDLDESDYFAISEDLGVDVMTGSGDWPPGLLSHTAGATPEGTFVVTEVWSSRADQDTFMRERLRPALAAGGVTAPPQVRWVPLVSYQTPGG